MGIEDVRSESGDTQLRYREMTDEIVRGLPATDTFRTADQLAGAGPEATAEMLERAEDARDKIRVALAALSYYASVLQRLDKDHPDAIDRLPEDQQAAVRDLANRVTTEVEGPNIQNVAGSDFNFTGVDPKER